MRRFYGNLSRATVAASVLMCASCYHYRVTAPGPENVATDYRTETTCTYLWGLIQNPPLVADECAPSRALFDFRVSTNFGYLLLSVLSLGIWVPMDLEWRCAKIPGPDLDDVPPPLAPGGNDG